MFPPHACARATRHEGLPLQEHPRQKHEALWKLVHAFEYEVQKELDRYFTPLSVTMKSPPDPTVNIQGGLPAVSHAPRLARGTRYIDVHPCIGGAPIGLLFVLALHSRPLSSEFEIKAEDQGADGAVY